MWKWKERGQVEPAEQGTGQVEPAEQGAKAKQRAKAEPTLQEARAGQKTQRFPQWNRQPPEWS